LKRMKVEETKWPSQRFSIPLISHFFRQFRSPERLMRRKRSKQYRLVHSSLFLDHMVSWVRCTITTICKTMVLSVQVNVFESMPIVSTELKTSDEHCQLTVVVFWNGFHRRRTKISGLTLYFRSSWRSNRYGFALAGGAFHKPIMGRNSQRGLHQTAPRGAKRNSRCAWHQLRNWPFTFALSCGIIYL
jgi:hypothetical protein